MFLRIYSFGVMQFARRIKFSSAIKGHFLLLHTLLVYRFLKIWINRMLLSLLSGIRNLTYSILKKLGTILLKIKNYRSWEMLVMWKRLCAKKWIRLLATPNLFLFQELIWLRWMMHKNWIILILMKVLQEQQTQIRSLLIFFCLPCFPILV